MSDHEMRNPYEDEIPKDEVRVPRKVAWLFIILFLSICVLPPLWRNVTAAEWRPVTELFKRNAEHDLRRHLKNYEDKLEEADFRTPAIRSYQRVATGLFREGNSKAYVGRGGTLFYRPALDAITGYGPLKPEPDTVAKDPNRPKWNSPQAAILKFKEQLAERGVDLMLVPIPVKPMIYPEQARAGSNGFTAPVRHPDTEEFFKSLREGGVEVVDFADEFFAARRTAQFLRQDTHWTPATMERTAASLAEIIAAKPWFREMKKGLETEIRRVEGGHAGDLAEMLHGDGQSILVPEVHEIGVVIDRATGQPVARDADSPIVLLGDSFVNIFNDPALGFGDREGPLLGAGFAQHLAAQLGAKIDYAVANGGGASVVRSEFGKRYDDEVRAKKLVVWVLASRDLFLSEKPARDAGISFKDTAFNPKQSPEPKTTPPPPPPASGDRFTGTLLDRTPNADPAATSYPEALYEAHFELDAKSAKELGLSDPEIVVYLWSFRNRKLLPSSQLQVGRSYQLKLSPWADHPKLQTMQRGEGLGVFAEEFFAEEATPAP